MNFDSIYSSVKDFAVRTADKLTHSADVATLQVKLAMAEKRLDEAYRNLGKLAYRNFSGKEDSAEKLQTAMSAVDAVKAEMKALRTQIEQKKTEAAEAEQKAKEEAAQRKARADAQAAETDEAAAEKSAETSDVTSDNAEEDGGVSSCEGDACPVSTDEDGTAGAEDADS